MDRAVTINGGDVALAAALANELEGFSGMDVASLKTLWTAAALLRRFAAAAPQPGTFAVTNVTKRKYQKRHKKLQIQLEGAEVTP